MKSIFFLLIFSFSLFAVDISDFDIKGIKLGMSKKEVLKEKSCTEAEIQKKYQNTISGKKVYETDIICNNSAETITIELNRKNIVYSINRTKEFKISPNWKRIEEKIIQKYKNPTYTIERNKPSERNSSVFRMRWNRNNKQLVIHSHNWNDIYLVFYLYDENIMNENVQWAVRQEKLYNQRQQEKASNIDL